MHASRHRALKKRYVLMLTLAAVGLSSAARAQFVGPEFRVNTYTTSTQASPSVASDPNGNFVVVWQSDGQDGSGYGVYGQFDHTFTPVELMTVGVE